MPYAENELFSETDGNGSNPRIFPTSTQPKTFAAGTGTVLDMTPVGVVTATGKWAVWNPAETNGTQNIEGILYTQDLPTKGLELDGADDVLGNVVLAGRVHVDDIVLPGAATANDLATALSTGEVRKKGITVEGLAGWK